MGRNGFFVKSTSGPASPDAKAPPPTPPAEIAKDVEKVEKEKASKPKKQENAGISPAERKELEQLKKDIVARKTQLKEEGLSGGQQNKDPQVVEMVKRMNELKEQKELDALRGEIEIYKNRLKTEFGYTAKDMKTDEDLLDMEKRLAALEKRS